MAATTSINISDTIVSSFQEAILKIKTAGFEHNVGLFINIENGALRLENRHLLLKTLKDHIIARAFGISFYNLFNFSMESFLLTMDEHTLAIFLAKMLYDLDMRGF